MQLFEVQILIHHGMNYSNKLKLDKINVGLNDTEFQESILKSIKDF